ncbi:MAG: hypothetical protein H0W83_08170 [Planctomycetes bacterium]|nr:hypothetical protein [Planctomycetota bacterium]
MTSATRIDLMFKSVNVGTAPATNIAYSVVRDDGKVIKTAVIPSLAAGASSDEMAMDDGSGAGHTFTISIDPQNTIREPNDANNVTTITSVVDPSTPINGDLRFIDGHYHGAVFYRDPQFHFWIENTTAADLAGVPYTIRQDGVDLPGYPKTAGIPAAGKKEIYENPFANVPFDGQPSGRHSYTVVIDPGNAFAETNEGNNSNRSEIVVPATYAYWPMNAGSKVDLRFQDPHYHGPQPGQIVVFHGWFTNAHDTLSISQQFHFVIKRNGVPITLPAPQAGRNIGYEVDADGTGLVTQPIAPLQKIEYVIHVYEPESLGDIPYSMDIDTRNEIDEQYESGAQESWINSNHADFIVVMNPQGTSG